MSYLVHQLLENSAQQYPDKEAVVYKDNSVTYRELDAVSNQLAWTLRNNGIEKGDRVGICLNKSIEENVAKTGSRTYYRFKTISTDLDSIPIGRACANTELFVVNDENQIAKYCF